MKTLAELIRLSVTAALMGMIVVLYPLSIIWSLNTLWHLNIPYEWQTWWATVILLTLGHSKNIRRTVDKP